MELDPDPHPLVRGTDPDPQQNVTDTKHWLWYLSVDSSNSPEMAPPEMVPEMVVVLYGTVWYGRTKTRQAAEEHGLSVQFSRTDPRKYSFAVRTE